jgi:hypothetical protein
MILESGTVVQVDLDSLLVETIQTSTCDTCVAEKGCGQRVLSKLTGKTNRIRVLFDSQSPKNILPGQSVTIGIPEGVSGACCFVSDWRLARRTSGGVAEHAGRFLRPIARRGFS